MKTFLGVLSIISFLLVGSINSMAKIESVGFVKSVSGDVFIISSNVSVKAVPNMKLIQGDSIKTSDKSSVGLIFEDDTVVSIGPNSQLEIQSYWMCKRNHCCSAC